MTARQMVYDRMIRSGMSSRKANDYVQRKFSRNPGKRKADFPLVKSLSEKVRKLISARELKWLDTAQNGATAAGTVVPLNLIPQGDDSVSRDGRKVTLESLSVKYSEVNAAFGTAINRFCIVWDVQPSGSLPSVTDIFTSSSTTAYPNLNNRDRFRVLYDSWLGNQTGCSPFNNNAGAAIWADAKYIKLDCETIYNDTTTAVIGAINSGALYCVYLGSATSPGFLSNFRVRFTDS